MEGKLQRSCREAALNLAQIRVNRAPFFVCSVSLSRLHIFLSCFRMPSLVELWRILIVEYRCPSSSAFFLFSPSLFFFSFEAFFLHVAFVSLLLYTGKQFNEERERGGRSEPYLFDTSRTLLYQQSEKQKTTGPRKTD